MSTWKPISGETPIDISGLRARGVVTRQQLNQLEFANINKAVIKYMARRPTRRSARFDVAWAKRLHKEMFADVWVWAGQFRRTQTNIGVAWRRIEVDLTQCLDNLRFREQHADFFDQAVWLHHQCVYIHPFPNGNGRWARLIANIWLKMHAQPITLWPDTIGQVSPVRQEYLATIRGADAGNLEPLTSLHRRLAQP